MASRSHSHSAEPTRDPFRYVRAVWRLVRSDPSQSSDDAAIVEIDFARSRWGRRFARWEDAVEALERAPGTAAALRDRRVFGRIDLEALRALPAGTLGRVFADHCRARWTALAELRERLAVDRVEIVGQGTREAA